ncbi:tail assembly chaperone [Gordonia phage Fryberger]|uniref:Tail assembly chaperone n=1 Tax=Gordonia phage Fryberger TaxID=2250392 RepID=A0A346FCK1_9CAUD|nr:tail assembly chaperone [Gordonia phage Fryberger]AXN53465.1 tail assembly chaperone [Gordonia phage Fryberger]
MTDIFTVPASQSTKKENQFKFKLGAKTFTIPKMQYLPGDAIDFIDEKAKEVALEWLLMRHLFMYLVPLAQDQIRGMSRDQIDALTKAWDEASTTDVGGILSLRGIIHSYPEAFEYDLLTHGYRPSLQELTLRELYVLASGFAKDESCHLNREIDPDYQWHTIPVMFDSLILHALQLANHQRGMVVDSDGLLVIPELITQESLARMLAENPEPKTDSVVEQEHPDHGRKRLPGTVIESADDLEKFKNEMEERRRQKREARKQRETP